ncbi:MAG: ABC transporter substrate-binding protein, partial [Ktedonobacteraceae bacterium]
MQQDLEHQFPKVLRNRGACYALVALSLVCIFLLTACGGPSANQPTSNVAKKGGNLKVGLIAEPTVLDPLTSVSLYDSDIMSNIYDSLFRYDANNQLQPMLVSTYAYTTPTTLDLKLRTGIKFQDGTPFNADAVIFNLNRFRNDKASPRYTDVSDITSLVKISDSELQIHLQDPFAPFLTALTGGAGYMLSPTAVQKLGTKLGNAPIDVGSGPFTFVEWIKGDH